VVVLPISISLIFAKKFNKVISQTRKFIFLVIHAHSKHKVVATSMASTQSLSLQKNKEDEIMEEYKDIFSSPTDVPMQCQVKHPIDLTPDAPLPNGLVYHHSFMENDKIKCQIQELLQKENIRPNSSYETSTVLVQKKDGM
jgi:hypothetical protein